MALPKRIQEAEAQADAALAQMAQALTSSPLAQQADEPPAQPPLEAPAAPEPAAPAEPPAPPVAPAPPTPAKPTVDWEQKYRSLQGVFNSQVPQLQRQVQELQQALQARQAPQAPVQEPPPVSREADPKDIEAFGADMVQMVQRVAQNFFGGHAAVFDARLKAVEQKLATVETTVAPAARSAEEVFFIRLTQLVPDWEVTNTDPAFLQWLDEIDPAFQVPRRAALEAAQQRLNADHAASVFRAFQAQAVPQAAPAQVAPTPDPLAAQVAPRQSAPAPAPTAEKPMVKASDVTKFYDDVSKGRYAGREAEQLRIESVINKALSEGRVVNS